MFSLLHLMSYVGALAAFLFVTLSLASGLLWLAELIEEHSRYAKTVGMRGIYTIISLHILLLYTDSLPALPVLFSITCHLIYLSNFTSSWPVISLSSPRFLASCALVIADHFTWFFHFANKANEAKRRSPNRYSYGAPKGRGEGEHGFMDVAAFFGICVWAAPLFLFLSLSANDNALPSSMASAPPSPGNAIDLNSPFLNGSPRPRQPAAPRTSILKSLLVPLVSLLPRLRRKNRRNDEGLLAPRTPIRGSPLHSPVPMSGTTGYFPWGNGPGSFAGAGGSGPGGGSGGLSRPGTPGAGPGASAYASASSSTSAFSSLSPEMAKKPTIALQRPPGPPRRVQSEMQVSRGAPGSNPRGIATRNGVPATPDSALGPASGSGGDGAEGLGQVWRGLRGVGRSGALR
ncbi:transmembrane adaptor Erv26-domain-containing protein [Dioszegia hungarica]|uniref:Transmembrane adaptor Erv26-domain-containing protein n=1 Tax=Dioszegia hungarica TaxID=4972 RepID=A0AA38H610_9TREE|nr:transmembrane adaptor Erv26-domain-containing protein [Dioszegia hungarica]KAI9633169.1 transmembrane adaptor Erv26-domain-containing protein [Dioszegia hungarica]